MEYKTVYREGRKTIHEEKGIMNIPKETIILIGNKKYKILGFGLLVDDYCFAIYIEFLEYYENK